MKRFLLILICLIMSVGTLFSCGDEEENKDNGKSNLSYQYDMKDYITLPSYQDYTVEIELDALQQMIDSYIMDDAVKSKRTICMQGDVVNITYYGYKLDENGEIIINDGKPVYFDTSDSYGVYLGSNMAISDFEKKILGMQIGDVKEFDYILPSDYQQSEMAGKAVKYEIILNSIYEPPIYNDSYIKSLKTDVNNVFDYEEKLKKELILTNFLTYISKNSSIISYPEKEYNALVNKLKDTEKSFEEENKITLDDYLKEEFGQTREEYIKSQIKKNMVYYALAQHEGLEITQEMLANEKSSLIGYYKGYFMSKGEGEEKALESAKALVNDMGENYIYENVLYEQVDGMIPHVVKVIEKPKTYKSITQFLAERDVVDEGDEIGEACPSYDMEVFNENGSLGTTLDPSRNLGRITVINFWGTWCDPCKKELVDFNKIATEYKDELTLYAVHSTEGYKKASEYILNNYVETDMIFLKDYLHDSKDEYSGDVYYDALGGANYYPYTVILDENGIIKYKHSGKLSYEEIKQLLVTEFGLTE